jgi:(p)ppGpp synthase/HD superfamily hydrolase
MNQNYEKMKMALRYRLQGKGYHKALRAMNFAEKFHTGTRKDGMPEFSHQISIAAYAITLLNGYEFEEELLCIIFLHDIMEDYSVSYAELLELFGKMVADGVKRMSKVQRGLKMDNGEYYRILGETPLSALAKGFDRVHNLMTMLGGFKPEKQMSYIKETTDYVLPLLKLARREFPEIELIVENIKFVMTNQIQLYSAMNKEIA